MAEDVIEIKPKDPHTDRPGDVPPQDPPTPFAALEARTKVLEERLAELEHAVASHAGPDLSHDMHDSYRGVRAWLDKFYRRLHPAVDKSA